MKTIEHEGIVKWVEGNHVKVQIVSMSACASCHANGACSAADMQDKEVDVISEKGTFEPGQQVVIIGSRTQGLKATWWAYVLPLVLVVATLAVTYTYSGNENLAGALALLVLVPYFFVIYLAGKAMKKTFSFSVKSKIG
jgi:sigma-E factor negative regulatory protein RseC